MRTRGVVLTVGVTLVVLVGCGPTTPAAPAETAEAAAALSTSVDVTYQVTGDGKTFDMTVTTPTGTSQASPDIPLMRKGGTPYTFAFAPGDFVYISAQITDGSTITCRIYENGRTISENTASGMYSIATCDGQA